MDPCTTAGISMTEPAMPRRQPGPQEPKGTPHASLGTHPWQEPRPTFVEPKVIKHGKLEAVTAGFFGGFTP
jgi:hypothetical protein